jgi:TRAP-type C4-dicarboxylate transport system permease small subunit
MAALPQARIWEGCVSSSGREQAGAVFRFIDKILLTIANLSLVIMVGVVCWTVWTRYVQKTPVVWGDDITSLTFAWFIFISMAAVHNRRGHVSIDIVTSLLPKPMQAFLDKLGELIVTVFCGYTAYLCIKQTIVAHTMSHTPVLNIPLSYFFASLAIGFGLMAIRSIGYIMGVRPIPLHEMLHQ